MESSEQPPEIKSQADTKSLQPPDLIEVKEAVEQQPGETGNSGDDGFTSNESVEGDALSEREAEGEGLRDDDKDIDEGEVEEGETSTTAPPLPDEAVPPPLPDEAPPGGPAEDDGWAPVWDENAQAFYFYNHFTGVSQWENPRVPDATTGAPASVEVSRSTKPTRPAGGYDPAIHGDYDPNADYAKTDETSAEDAAMAGQNIDPSQEYAATGAFNRFTGRWQAASLNPENFNDEAKSRRQMNAFFDVDAAANSHDGRSLKAERSAKKLSKKEVKAFRDKRREKKEEKRRAWLRD